MNANQILGTSKSSFANLEDLSPKRVKQQLFELNFCSTEKGFCPCTAFIAPK